MEPKEIIDRELVEIEKKEGVKVIFAVEAGSRAWGIQSKDSDYDIRFIFSSPLKRYLKINKPSEIIQKAFDKEGDPHSIEGGFIDMFGMDLYKFTKLLSASNPSAIEWLISTLLYKGKKPEGFVKFAREFFNPTSLYYHYKSMAKQNFLK